jgi:hypothetical protein
LAIVSDYVPYEERVQRAKEAQDAARVAQVREHRQQLEAVQGLLAQLAGRDTNCYLEILRPQKGLRRHLSATTTITKPGLKGGPHFAIAEVLPAYRIPNAIWAPPFKGERSGPFNAYVVPDGRVWRYMGEGETHDTYQLLESSGQQMVDLFANDLGRVADGLTLMLSR